jgi:hypothetical protein
MRKALVSIPNIKDRKRERRKPKHSSQTPALVMRPPGGKFRGKQFQKLPRWGPSTFTLENTAVEE